MSSKREAKYPVSLTAKQIGYLMTLLGYDINHYTEEVERTLAELASISKDNKDTIKELKKSLKYYSQCMLEAETIMAGMRFHL